MIKLKDSFPDRFVIVDSEGEFGWFTGADYAFTDYLEEADFFEDEIEARKALVRNKLNQICEVARVSFKVELIP